MIFLYPQQQLVLCDVKPAVDLSDSGIQDIVKLDRQLVPSIDSTSVADSNSSGFLTFILVTSLMFNLLVMTVVAFCCYAFRHLQPWQYAYQVIRTCCCFRDLFSRVETNGLPSRMREARRERNIVTPTFGQARDSLERPVGGSSGVVEDERAENDSLLEVIVTTPNPRPSAN